MQQHIYKKYLRLSMARDRYTLAQAAFRLNTSRNTIWTEFIQTGLVKGYVDSKGRKWVLGERIKNYLQQAVITAKQRAFNAKYYDPAKLLDNIIKDYGNN